MLIFLKNSLCIQTCLLAVAKPWLLLGLPSPKSSFTKLLACRFPVYLQSVLLQLINLEDLALLPSHSPHYLRRPACLSDSQLKDRPFPETFPDTSASHVILWLAPAFPPLWPHFSLLLPYHSSFAVVHRAVGLCWPVISLK